MKADLKDSKIEFIRLNHSDVLLFVNNEMSLSDEKSFANKIKHDVGYKNYMYRTALKKIFKNSLSHFELIETLESL